MTPTKINLKKDEKLELEWPDGARSSFSVASLRALCPCAACRITRDHKNPHDISPKSGQSKKPLLTVLPGNYEKPITVTDAELVGNYAIKLVFSDGHDTGIYSFEYLRSLTGKQ
jgi:DUF971 family protein